MRYQKWFLAAVLVLSVLASTSSSAPAPTFSTIDFPGASFTVAFGINNRGEIVGNYGFADGTGHGFLLDKGNFRTIDFPGAFTQASGINNRGQIVGAAGRTHGFLLDKGNFTTIDFPGAPATAPKGALGINDGGQIVGFYGTSLGFLLD